MQQNTYFKKVPEVSVILPVYMVQQYIEECLQLLINQTFTNFELLIINDNTKDNSVSIAQSFLSFHNFANFRIIDHLHTQGLSAARNTGIKAARGRFLVFVDSDDRIPENSLENLYNEIIHNPESIICGNTETVIDGIMHTYWTSVGARTEYEKNDAIRRMLIYDQLLDTAWAKIYPKSLFLNYGIFFPQNIYFEDTPTNMRLFNCAKSIIGIPNTVYYYRQNRAGSILQQKNIKSVTDRLWVFSDIYQYVVNETEISKDFALDYYLEVIVNEFRSVFGTYRLTLQEQFIAANRIDSMIRLLKKQLHRSNFRKEIGIKFDILLNNFANRNRIMFFLLHNRQYSIVSKLIDTYLKKEDHVTVMSVPPEFAQPTQSIPAS